MGIKNILKKIATHNGFFMMISASLLERDMYSEFDKFDHVIRTYGVNRAAVKHALRMRRQLMQTGDLDGATEWHVFALGILKRIRRSPRRNVKKITLH